MSMNECFVIVMCVYQGPKSQDKVSYVREHFVIVMYVICVDQRQEALCHCNACQVCLTERRRARTKSP